MTDSNYKTLRSVLDRAYDQAATGKGKARHSTGQAFEAQPIVALQSLYGPGYAYGQASKKMEEAQRLDTPAAVAELLGAINYLAAAVIHLEGQRPEAFKSVTPLIDRAQRAVNAARERFGDDLQIQVSDETWAKIKREAAWVPWAAVRDVDQGIARQLLGLPVILIPTGGHGADTLEVMPGPPQAALRHDP